MATKIETTELSTMTAVALRKLAGSLGIKGMSSGRKVDLIAKIEQHRSGIVQGDAAQAAAEEELREAAREHDAAAERIVAELDAKAKRDSKGVIQGTKCQICGTRPVNRKTQGRDSTMCRPCYDYAGWENSHSDEDHEGSDQGLHADCPVCATLDPKPIKSAKKVSTPAPIVNGENPKAARFTADAVAAGWKVESITKIGNVTTVIVFRGLEEWIQISWDGTQCVNTGTTHKGTDGKIRKVRNASAARKILAG